MSKEVGQKFAEALHRLEDSRDLEAMVAMYTEDCEIGNVVVPEKYHGHDGARKFWTIYRDTFGEARSEFRNIFGGESRAALEWTTSGTNTTGGAFSYDGVSVLELEGEKVVRFRAYFDASELGR
ncbi:MAG: nuclear transport factor 2 family protein, partial [Pyrinomonadaceae bacterium]